MEEADRGRVSSDGEAVPEVRADKVGVGLARVNPVKKRHHFPSLFSHLHLFNDLGLLGLLGWLGSCLVG